MEHFDFDHPSSDVRALIVLCTSTLFLTQKLGIISLLLCSDDSCLDLPTVLPFHLFIPTCISDHNCRIMCLFPYSMMFRLPFLFQVSVVCTLLISGLSYCPYFILSMKEFLAGNTILQWPLLSLYTLKVICYWVWLSLVPLGCQLSFKLFLYGRYGRWFVLFLWLHFKIFSLYLMFCNFIKVCLNMNLFLYILL